MSAGAASIIVAIVGGGAKAFGVEVPIIASRGRQAALALVGVAFLATAVVLRDDGDATRGAADASGPSEAVADYRQDVLTACNSLTVSSLPQKFSYESSEIRAAWQRDIKTYRRVFRELWAQPVPDALDERARTARRTSNRTLARMDDVFTRLGGELPPTVDIETLLEFQGRAAAELTQPFVGLEAAMSRLAGRDCGLVGPTSAQG